MSPATKALLLTVEESVPSRPDLGHHYQKIADAKATIVNAVQESCGITIVDMYDALVSAAKPGPQLDGIKERPLKNMLLGIMCKSSSFDKTEAATRALNQLNSSPFMSDKSRAFVELLDIAGEEPPISASLGLESTFNAIKQEWTAHPIGCEAYISAICQTDCCKSPEYIRGLVNEPFFKLELAGHARSVARGWTRNRKRALLTDEGLELTKELFFKIAKINQMSAYSFLSAFGDFKKFENESIRLRLVNTMKEMRDGLDEKKQESLFKQLNVMLK